MKTIVAVGLLLSLSSSAHAEYNWLVCDSAKAWVRVCKDGVSSTRYELENAKGEAAKKRAQKRFNEAVADLAKAENDRDRDCKQ